MKGKKRKVISVRVTLIPQRISVGVAAAGGMAAAGGRGKVFLIQ